MNCNCNFDQNYEVIGLCDVSKIGNLPDKDTWTQISIPEVFTIPCAKPDIEYIDKVYIKAKILSSRVIVTPPAIIPPATAPVPVTNEEGTSLTGRKLIVDGLLCQTVVYTALNCEQSVHSAHFNVPFTTFIVLPENIDPDLKEYCVDVCIEDVYAKVLCERRIFKNVTLFLKAKEIAIAC